MGLGERSFAFNPRYCNLQKGSNNTKLKSLLMWFSRDMIPRFEAGKLRQRSVSHQEHKPHQKIRSTFCKLTPV